MIYDARDSMLVGELKICTEHRLALQRGVSDDGVNMQEQTRKAAGEIRQETFRHRSDLTLHMVRKVLIVMFLVNIEELVLCSG